MKSHFLESLGRWLGGVLAILVLGGATYLGVQKAGEQIAEKIPKFPSPSDIVDTIGKPEPFETIARWWSNPCTTWPS